MRRLATILPVALTLVLLSGCMSRTERLFQRAEMFLSQGQPELAGAEYYRLAVKYPRSSFAPNALYKLAYLYREEYDDPPKAIQTYRVLAERYPEIVRWTFDAGHEIATHTYTHQFVSALGQKAFEESLARSLEILQSLAPGQPIRGHRAPAFSLPRDQKWPFDILRAHGIEYDSSINPHATYLYGDAQAPRFPYTLHGIVELPPAVVEWAGFRFPVGGGGTLRVLPSWYLERARRRYQAEGFPPVIYIHPWEMVPGHPPLSLPWKPRWIHYAGLRTTRRKLRALLQNHTAISLGDYYQRLMEEEPA